MAYQRLFLMMRPSEIANHRLTIVLDHLREFRRLAKW